MQPTDTMPITIVITHFINLFCIVLLIRSGLHILADHPMLYWTDDTSRENYWIKFGKKEMPTDKLWTAHDEAEHIGHYAMPGGAHKEFGLARDWHFATAIIWMITGLVYWGYLFTSGEWRRLIPTDWGVFARAWSAAGYYVHFQAPPLATFTPYDGLQQITYGILVFIVAPLMVITGLAMSPAFTARFPGFVVIFGGRRQAARSIHFLGMLVFSAFILVHVTLVALVYFDRNVKLITYGTTDVRLAAAVIVLSAALLFVLVFNVVATWFTLKYRRATRRILVAIINPVTILLFSRLRSHQQYTREEISPFFRVNGYPPTTDEYKALAASDFGDWRLEVSGLVECPLSLSLDEIKALPKQEQITKHICIQGWSDIAEWGGAHMREIISLCRPTAEARFVVFHAYDVDGNNKPYYEALRLADMFDPQTILAYEMNWQPLNVPHGAPLRLRIEKKLGYKMVKYIRAIEFVSSFKPIEGGLGGYREDNIFFDWEAAI